ncbi:ribosome biogenesis protein Nop53/GLTSCR2 [Dipodascopsis tothii]|uniref:ribosome biogenesis protein Nop53/GLTSCR2 n=1 Tax=Dipodascopsis tothii TaxID=44089 RepID=UPI0034CE63B9
MASVSTGAPRQASQSSRKGKRAWRKNVDISDIQQGLEAVEEEKRVLGAPISEIESDSLFAVDTTASVTALKKAEKRPLKVDEILSANRSSIPALASRKRSATVVSSDSKKAKIQGVSVQELGRLLKQVGRHRAHTGVPQLETDSRLMPDTYDVWDTAESTIAEKSVLKDDTRRDKKLYSNAAGVDLPKTLAHVHPVKPPTTLKQRPEKFKKTAVAVDIPNEGTSYNPSVSSWQSLLAAEHETLQKEEEERIAAEQHKQKLAALAEYFEAREQAGEDIESDSEDEVKAEDAEPKIEDAKAAEKKKKKKKKAKKQPKENTNTADKVYTAKVAETAVAAVADADKIRKHKLGKYATMKTPLAVKLSDELSDSLRTLKPEGNLARDRFISMQERGILEARKQVMPGRKYKRVVTEKWKYKDIK